jgi:hypothetical protein
MYPKLHSYYRYLGHAVKLLCTTERTCFCFLNSVHIPFEKQLIASLPNFFYLTSERSTCTVADMSNILSIYLQYCQYIYNILPNDNGDGVKKPPATHKNSRSSKRSKLNHVYDVEDSSDGEKKILSAKSNNGNEITIKILIFVSFLLTIILYDC